MKSEVTMTIREEYISQYLSKSSGAGKIRHIAGGTDDNPSHSSRILFQTQIAEFLVLTTQVQGFAGQQ
jgi:hypothetical protein